MLGAKRLDLSGAVVFITGGSRGLGLELAREFGASGAQIAFCARDADEVERARGDLAGRGIAAAGYVADVTKQEEIGRTIAAVEQRFGKLDVLVNNAGTIEVGPMDEMTLDDYRRAMDTHFWAAVYAVEAALPGMRRRMGGRIVNVSSIGGRISFPHLLPYSASKFALVGYSEGLRAQLRRERIYVTTVIPGLMRTGSPENAEFKGQNRLEYAWFTISDSLPFSSVDVTTAARRILEATQAGKAELTISMPATFASIVHGVVPGLFCDVLGIVAALMPGSGGIGRQSRRGRDSHSSAAPAFLIASTERRAVTQNEVS